MRLTFWVVLWYLRSTRRDDSDPSAGAHTRTRSLDIDPLRLIRVARPLRHQAAAERMEDVAPSARGGLNVVIAEANIIFVSGRGFS